jgi:hypothetical protein
VGPIVQEAAGALAAVQVRGDGEGRGGESLGDLGVGGAAVLGEVGGDVVLGDAGRAVPIERGARRHETGALAIEARDFSIDLGSEAATWSFGWHLRISSVIYFFLRWQK